MRTMELLCLSTADMRSSHDFSAAAYYFAFSCSLIRFARLCLIQCSQLIQLDARHGMLFRPSYVPITLLQPLLVDTGHLVKQRPPRQLQPFIYANIANQSLAIGTLMIIYRSFCHRLHGGVILYPLWKREFFLFMRSALWLAKSSLTTTNFEYLVEGLQLLVA